MMRMGGLRGVWLGLVLAWLVSFGQPQASGAEPEVAKWAGQWEYANGAMGEFYRVELRDSGDFVWIVRDEPLKAEDRFSGKWKAEKSGLRLEFEKGETKSGERIAPKQRTLVLPFASSGESLILNREHDFRLERVKSSVPKK